MGRLVKVGAILAAIATISACAPDAVSDADEPPDQEEAAQGEEPKQHCAPCHQADLSGDSAWETPNDDGSYPPPPHDSSGHTQPNG